MSQPAAHPARERQHSLDRSAAQRFPKALCATSLLLTGMLASAQARAQPTPPPPPPPRAQPAPPPLAQPDQPVLVDADGRPVTALPPPAAPSAAPTAAPGSAPPVRPPPPAYPYPGYRPPAAPPPAGYAPPASPVPAPAGAAPGYRPPGYPPARPYGTPYHPGYRYQLPPQGPPPPPPPRMVRNSTPLMVGGIVLISAGGLGVIVGLSMLQDAEDQDCVTFPCETTDKSQQVAGAVVTGVALAAVAGGIPMTFIGAQRVPEQAPERPAAAPIVALGLGGLSLRWIW